MKIKAALELSMRLGATHVFKPAPYNVLDENNHVIGTEQAVEFEVYQPAKTIPGYFARMTFTPLDKKDEYTTDGKWQLIHQLPKGASALE